jgi:FkbM family methyltransferase
LNAIKDLLFRVLNNFKGVKFNINGHLIRLDESLRRWDYSSEQGMFNIMQERLRPGDGFIDIGANFGLHAVFAASIVSETGQVVAVEPLPKNVSYLTKHCELNKILNMDIVQAVVSNDSAKQIEFFFPDEQFIQTGGLKSKNGEDKKLLVDNLTLNNLVSRHNRRFNMVKVDVEGAEMDVILGGEDFLRRNRPDLLIEIHGFALPSFGYSVEDILGKLKAIGYKEKRLLATDQKDDYFQSFFYYP